jgi:hypothetical protein
MRTTIVERMFDTRVDPRTPVGSPANEPARGRPDEDVAPNHDSTPGEAWSRYLPDGLLADMLSVASGGSCWDRVERIGGWERIIAWAQANQLRAIAGFVRAASTDPAYGGDPEQVGASVCAEVGLITRVSPRTADGRVGDAVALVERLPTVLDALAEGRISLAGARAVGEETGSLSEELLPEVQSRVLRRAGEQTPSQIRAATRRAVAGLDAAAVRRRAEKARQERHVRLIPEPDGMATLSAYLSAADAVGVYGVLDDCARRAAGPRETRTMDARRADALVDFVLDRLVRPLRCAPGDGAQEMGIAGPRAPGPRPGCGRSSRDRARVQVRVTVPLTTLLGLDRLPGELAGFGPVPAGVARELAAQGTWRRLVTDPLSGALLDYGTTRYRPPPHLAEHVIARDQTCDFPSCRVPAHRCDLDHRVPHDPDTDKGATSADNLGARCRGHHQLKASPGWHLTRQPGGAVVWHSPTGHRYRRLPPPSAEPTATIDAPPF